jgi:hypothetical protein
MEKIFNLTQHVATEEQLQAGVWEPYPEAKPAIQKLLTFEKLPTAEEIQATAESLAKIAKSFTCDGTVMIGGATYLMSALERALRARGMKPVHAFSKREVKESKLPDGGVKKEIIFKHVGFVEVP